MTRTTEPAPGRLAGDPRRFGAARLYRDAGSIATSSAANAVLGLAFWAIAARLLPPERLGVMTAVLAVIIGLGLVVASGIGDAYTALLPAVGQARVDVYRRGQRVFMVTAVSIGIVAALGTPVLLKEVRGSVGVAVLIAVGVVAWSAFVLQNSTLAALGRARWQPIVNIVMSLGRIVLLPVLILTVSWHSVEVATVVCAAAVVLVLRPMILRVLNGADDLPMTTSLSVAESIKEFNRLVVATMASVALSLGLLIVSPSLVTAFGGPSQGALFALSLSIVQALDLIGAAMGVSLVVHASGAPEQTWSMARSVLIKTAALVAAGAVVIAALTPVGLTLLNPEYGAMGAVGVVGLMCAGSVIRVPYMVWAAMQRARRNMKALLTLNFASAALFLGTVPGMADRHGAVGGATALLVAQSVLSAGAALHMLLIYRRRGHRGKEAEVARHSKLVQNSTVEHLYATTDLSAEVTRWGNATWVGQVDEREIAGDRLVLDVGEGFRHARLLVWSNDQARGFVELSVEDGAVDVGSLRSAVAGLPELPTQVDLDFPPISVVLCTKDRPDRLRDALESLLAVEYPRFEILVVDNNPASGLTGPIVDTFPLDIVRSVDAPRPGLSIARNEGIKNARYDIIAFTDDDVIVDHRWLTGLARGFSRSDRVACVCGMVPSAELLTPAQSYFDRRVGWARRCDPAVYDLSDPPSDDPLFPLRVAQYGTGANFAVRKQVVTDVGGFDECLGVGSPAGGGEDIDMFVRILLHGHVLVRQPSAVVWHRHRRSIEELERQIEDYGLGLGAWITKLLTRPRTFTMVIRRLHTGIRHLRGVTVVEQNIDVHPDPELDSLYRRELKGVLRGPGALLRGRVSGRRAAPLKSVADSPLTDADPARRDTFQPVRAVQFAFAATVLGLVGALGAVQMLPSALLALVVAAFLLAAPGCLALSWYTHLPAYALAALVPVVSLAICVLAVSVLLMFGVYSPVWVLLGLTCTTAVGGLLRCLCLAERAKSNDANARTVMVAPTRRAVGT
jgi:GT2 family glycosyltransferase/O-antigen/teichoic acid export membrane protein